MALLSLKLILKACAEQNEVEIYLIKLKLNKHIVCMAQKMLCNLRCLESKHLQNEQN